MNKYMEPTAFHDQKQYFLSATKAYSMTVKETASRLRQIIAYMANMPGAPQGDDAVVYSDAEEKMTLYRLMRLNWKANFDASGSDITGDNYMWAMLVRYMAAQERR